MLRFPHIGMRIVKTALAVFLTLVLSDILDRLILDEYLQRGDLTGLTAVTATIITMQGDLGKAFRAGRERFLSTFFGAVFGLSIMMLLIPLMQKDISVDLQRYIVYVVASCGAILVMYLCVLFRLHNILVLCVIVYVAVLFSVVEERPFLMASTRIAETIIGILVALVTNIVLVPPKSGGASLGELPEAWLEAKCIRYNKKVKDCDCHYCQQQKMYGLGIGQVFYAHDWESDEEHNSCDRDIL